MSRECTCRMGGSYIFNCPIHGEKESLIQDAKRKLRKMTKPQLRRFLESKP